MNNKGLYTIKVYNKDNSVKGIYVGITKNFKARKRAHIYNIKTDKTNHKLYNNMRKYKYSIDIEFETEDRELLNEMEVYYISQVRLLENIECYNVTDGGDGVSGFGVELDMYNLEGVFVKSFKTGLEAMGYVGATSSSSILCCAKGGDNVTAYGYIWRYKGDDFYVHGDIFNDRYLERSLVRVVNRYTKDGKFIESYSSCMEVERMTGIINTSISRVCTGKQHSTADDSVWRYEGDSFDKYSLINKCIVKVDKYSLYGELLDSYDSIVEAENNNKEYNCSRQNIHNCCKGKRRTCGGFIWRYNGDDFLLYEVESQKVVRKVQVFNLSGDLINTYNSGKEVERELGIPQSSVSSCCLGKMKTAKGYTFKYLYNY